MKISPTHYNDAGELMAPRPFDVDRVTVTPGGRPSLDPGFYHRFKFEGRTQAEFEDKARRFFAEMAEVSGYMRLTLREYTVRMDTYVRFGLDVLYVIESPEGAPKRRVAFTETPSVSAPATSVTRRP